MIKRLVSILFVFSILFISIEGTIDSVSGEHAHGNEHVHIQDDDSDGLSDEPQTENHCSHCGHGHSGGIHSNFTAFSFDVVRQQSPLFSPDLVNLPLAPPTPPPNV